MHRTLFIAVLFAALVSAAPAYAEGDEVWAGDDGWGAEEVPFAHIRLDPRVEAYLGARVADVDGSPRAAEYDIMNTMPVGGFLAHYYPLPHRLDIEYDFVDTNNMSADLAYAYKDLFLLSYTMMGLWHNLGHDLFAEGGNSTDLNPTMVYGTGITDNRAKLRLKWPDNPYHFFASFRDYSKEGVVQQRYLIGQHGGSTKYAEMHEIDWNTRIYMVGANGHFGPAELEYMHGIKSFKSSGGRMRDNYPGIVSDPVRPTDRPAGVYDHNVAPDHERSYDRVKIHTSYTGRIVGTATYYHSDKKNEFGGSTGETNSATTAWTFIPLDGLTVAMSYMFNRNEVNNPSAVWDFEYLTGTKVRLNSLADHRSISSDRHLGKLAVRYSPIKQLSVKAEYKFENTSRENAYMWHDDSLGLYIPSSASKHTANLTAWLRPVRMLNIKAGGTYSYCTDPAYPTSYRSRLDGNVTANLMPMPEVNLNAYYKVSREENPFDYPGQNTDRDRTVRRDTVGCTMTWLPLEWLSTTMYYNYNRVKVKSSTTFETNPPDHRTVELFHEAYSPYRDTSHVYGLGFGTSFDFPVNIDCEFHQSHSRGRFTYSSMYYSPIFDVYFDATDIPGIANMRLMETGGSVTAMVELPMGFGVDLNYSINNFDDRESHPDYTPLDGTAHSGIVMVRKTW